MSPATVESCLGCVLWTKQNGDNATVRTAGVEKLSSAGEFEEGTATPGLHMYSLGAGVVLNSELPEVAVFTEQIPAWQYLWSYRLVWHHKYSKLTNILFSATYDVTQLLGDWLLTEARSTQWQLSHASPCLIWLSLGKSLSYFSCFVAVIFSIVVTQQLNYYSNCPCHEAFNYFTWVNKDLFNCCLTYYAGYICLITT